MVIMFSENYVITKCNKFLRILLLQNVTNFLEFCHYKKVRNFLEFCHDKKQRISYNSAVTKSNKSLKILPLQNVRNQQSFRTYQDIEWCRNRLPKLVMAHGNRLRQVLHLSHSKQKYCSLH